ncbi:MAG TPA: hypothetical protein VH438_16995 [Gemmatimonadales bacterium]|jgi:hypothetical protein
MTRLIGLPGLALWMIFSCDSAAAPTSHNAGNWSTLPVPSGGSIVFSLDTAGVSVRGDGQEFGLMGRPQGTFTITGLLSYPAIALKLTYSSGRSATYSATFQTPDQLKGTWTAQGQPPSESVVFVRQ